MVSKVLADYGVPADIASALATRWERGDEVQIFKMEATKLPPSANSSWKFRKCGRGNCYLAQEVLDFRAEMAEKKDRWVEEHGDRHMRWNRQCKLTIWVCPSRRVRDLDNCLKPINDAAEECGILENDNCIVEIEAKKCLCRKCSVRLRYELTGYPHRVFQPVDDQFALDKECERKRTSALERKAKKAKTA